MLVRVSTSFTSFLFAVRTCTFASAYRKETGDFFALVAFITCLLVCLKPPDISFLSAYQDGGYR